MFSHCELVLLILALTLDRQVHTVVGGKEALPHSRPYMVIVEMRTEDNSGMHCGGFLLNEEFVLTAASCKAESYKALLGVHDYHKQNGVQHVSVEQAFPHENYSRPTMLNDIMLLKLSSTVKFNKNVKSIALAEQKGDSLPKSCLVPGWGITSDDDEYMSDVLREVNVALNDDKQCAESNWYCSKEETGPGKGDSGCPLVCEDGKAYGVVSHRRPKQETDAHPTYVFTKIPDYRGWINSMIEYHGKKHLDVCTLY